MTKNILSEKAVLVSLSIAGWSARKLDRKITDETNKQHNATADAGRYNKLLINAEALKPLTKIQSAGRLKHYEMTQPWFDEGARILPTALFMKYTQEMKKFRLEFEREAETFARRYPTLMEQSRQRLGSMFDARDFPAACTIRSRFEFKQRVLPCPDPSDFRVSLANEQMEDIRSDVEARMKEALDGAMKDSVERIVEVVGRMADRMKNFTPGEREGIFRDTLVTNIRDLVQLLPAFNLTGNVALTKITKRMHEELCAHDAQELRNDKALRRAAEKSATSILADVEALML